LDTGPLLTGLVQGIGLKRTILACMGLLAAGTGLSLFMTAPWQLFITWGLMVGIGAGGGAVGVAAAIANRWFVARSGLAMGLLSAANAAGQLAFLPLLALLAEQYGWQGVAVAVTLPSRSLRWSRWSQFCCPSRRRILGSGLTAQPPTEGDGHHQAIRSQSR
jgi:MFS family permease